MKFSTATLFTAAIASNLPGVAAEPKRDEPRAASTGQVIVGFKDGREKESSVADILDEFDGCNPRAVRESSLGLWKVFDVGDNEEEVLARLAKDDAVAYSVPNRIFHTAAGTNDPSAGDQYALDVMKLYDAWDITTGSENITIGVCDTGIDLDHPDLAGNMLDGYNAIDELWNNDVGTAYGEDHGTAVAGSCAAIGNNGEGISGMGWNFKHRAGQVANAPGGFSDSATINVCIEQMCMKSDVKVVVVSWSGEGDPSRHAAAQVCRDNYDTLVVNAAGNANAYIDYSDADSDSLIVVAATDSSDNKAGFSNYGPMVDVWAPGDAIFTARDSDVFGALYGYISGTSFSAPIVAGVIALIWAANPALTPDEVEGILKRTCDKPEGLDLDTFGGYGRVNAYEAVAFAVSGETFEPTKAPTNSPTGSAAPTAPTGSPTNTPTNSPSVSNAPTGSVTNAPTGSDCMNTVVIDFQTDTYPDESFVEISHDGEVIHTLSYSPSECQTLVSHELEGFCSGWTYRVTVHDTYGDGITESCDTDCNNVCLPAYVSGTAFDASADSRRMLEESEGQPLFHLTDDFFGYSVGAQFTIQTSGKSGKSGKSAKAAKAPKKA